MIIKKYKYTKIRKVMLTPFEIQEMIHMLSMQPHDAYDHFNYDKIVKKLIKAIK